VRHRTAAYLDRDGTLVEDAHYAADAARIRLVPGAAEAVRALNDMGAAVVIVTNQSGIAQGLIRPQEYEATRERTVSLFAKAGARIDATYHCPHHPAVSGPCDCRKPGTALYRRAAAELGLSLEQALYAGDRRRDVEPAIALGGVAVLVPSPSTPPDDVSWAREHALVLPRLADAVVQFAAVATRHLR
jgi:histidinol-phosphate phosphatase family protein